MKNDWRKLRLFGLVCFLLGGLWIISEGTAQHAQATSIDFLETLDTSHPRLLATDADFDAIKQLKATDSFAADQFNQLQAKADAMVDEPVIAYRSGSGNILDLSRKVLDRIYTLGMIYKLTDDTDYLDRATDELLAAANFPNWNEPHFLDTAEMSHAFAIGYDWLYDDLSSAERETIRNALIDKALTPAAVIYGGNLKNGQWRNYTNNWNVVVNSGISLGALAIADENPSLAQTVLQGAYTSIQKGLSSFKPDGSYPEGIMYWNYATKYAYAYFAGLRTAVGTDYGMSQSYGLPVTGDFPLYMSGPDMVWSTGDAATNLLDAPHLFWMADEYEKPLYANYAIHNAGVRAENLIWYKPGLANMEYDALDRLFPDMDFALFRSDWSDPNALYTGLKGGKNGVNHTDLDLGAFVLDALGIRWGAELTSENYNLPGYFHNLRWQYYRKRAEGQNVIVINPSGDPDQKTNALANIVQFEANDHDAFAVVNLNDAYSNEANSVKRGIRLLDQRRQVFIQDEIQAKAPSDIWWFMQTRASIRISADGKSARLQSGDKQLLVQLLTSGPERFEMMDAKPMWNTPNPEGIAPNINVRKLVVHMEDTVNAQIPVLFTPLYANQEPNAGLPSIEPIANWQLKEGPFAELADLKVDGQPVDYFNPKNYQYGMYVEQDDVPVVTASVYSGYSYQIYQVTGADDTAYVDVWADSTPSKVSRYAIHFTTGIVQQDPDGLPVVEVTASSSDTNFDPTFTLDNNLVSRWEVTGDGDHWIQYDLGQLSSIHAVTIAWKGGQFRSTKFKIQISDNGSSWTNVFDGSSSGLGNVPELYDIGNQTARYVRIVGEGNTPSTEREVRADETAIYELELFASLEEAWNFIHANVEITSVTAASDIQVIEQGNFAQITVEGQWPHGVTAEINTSNIRYMSSNPNVIEVDADGKAYATGEGSATITIVAKAYDKLVYTKLDLTAVQPDVKKVLASEDAHVYLGSPTTNFGSSANLGIKDGTSIYKREAYMQFSLTNVVPEGWKITSATLNVYGHVHDSNGSEQDVNIYTMDDSWTEHTVTWETKPSLGTTLTDIHFTDTWQWYTADVTQYAQQQLTADHPISLGIAQDVNHSGLNVQLKSRETAGLEPYLQVHIAPIDPIQVLASEDTFVTIDAPTTNYGSGAFMNIKDGGAALYQREAYLKFSLTEDVPEGWQIISATLKLYGHVHDTNGNEQDVDIYTMNESWAEHTVTWATKPSLGTKLTDIHFTDTWQWYTADVTQYAQQQLAAGQPISLGIAQDANHNGLNVQVKSRETTDFEPYLDVIIAPLEPVQIIATEDTFVHDGNPNTNYGSAAELMIKDSGANYNRETFLRFDLSNHIPPDLEIPSVTLYVYGKVHDTGVESEVVIYGSDDSWAEDTVNWNNKPSPGSSLGTINFVDVWKWYLVDLTDYVRQQAATGPIISLHMAQDLNNGGLNVKIKSRDVSGFEPYLKFTY